MYYIVTIGLDVSILFFKTVLISVLIVRVLVYYALLLSRWGWFWEWRS